MRRRLDKSLADYVTIGLTPALIMLLVGSLMFFLLLVGYEGNYDQRVRWIMGCFVVAIVLIGRISMEEGAEKAVLYGIALTGATALAVLRFIEQPLMALGALGAVWYAAHKLTWDCTFIDEQEDASGEGLLQVVGLEQPDEATLAARSAAEAVNPADTSPWRQLFGRRREKKSAPGVWVVYFSLAALPLFGLGQRFIPASNLDARREAFWYLVLYVGSALALLLTTSFLGLRRYLRQRKLQMPPLTTGMWMGVGAALIVLVLAVCAAVPRPSPEYAAGSFTGRLNSEQLDASQYAMLDDSGTQDAEGGAPGSNENSEAEPSGAAAADEGSSKASSAQSAQSQQSGSSQEGRQKTGSGRQGEGGESSGGGQPSNEQSTSSAAGQQQPSTSGEQGDVASSASGSDSPSDEGDSDSAQSEPGDEAGEDSSHGSAESWTGSLPDLSQGLFYLVRWAVNLVLLAVLAFVVLRYRRELWAGFRQLGTNLRQFWAALFGGRQPAATEEAASQATTSRPLTLADFGNPFHRPLAGTSTPDQLVVYSFRALEAWANDHGQPRRPEETPDEFAERLAADHAAMATPIREVAALYARLNYGQAPLPAHCLRSLQAFWQRLENYEALTQASASPPL